MWTVIAEADNAYFVQGQLTDGSVFDSSYERGDPIEFELGSGQVIKGAYKIAVENDFICDEFALLYVQLFLG